MVEREPLIPRKLRSSCLEGRMALIQPLVNFLKAFAKYTRRDSVPIRLNASER
jgi:hypothetical protein